jgi:hypothetical protein
VASSDSSGERVGNGLLSIWAARYRLLAEDPSVSSDVRRLARVQSARIGRVTAPFRGARNYGGVSRWRHVDIAELLRAAGNLVGFSERSVP